MRTAHWWRSQRATRGWCLASATTCGARCTPASTSCSPTSVCCCSILSHLLWHGISMAVMRSNGGKSTSWLQKTLSSIAATFLVGGHRSEAAALLGRECSAREAALFLGPHADMVVVTDGADGSCISALGSLQVGGPDTNHPCHILLRRHRLLAHLAHLQRRQLPRRRGSLTMSAA